MLKLGDIVLLKEPILNNTTYSVGICYDEYTIGDSQGVSIIFENGNYDGFSNDEQDLYLSFLTHKQLTNKYF